MNRLKNQADLRKSLVLWLGSFIVTGLLLFFYFGAPLIPILLAGALTGLVAFFRYFRSKKP